MDQRPHIAHRLVAVAIWIAGSAALFTAAQAYFQRRQTVDARRLADEEADRRLKERNANSVQRRREEEAALDMAFLTVWAEHFRIESLANQWKDADLIARSLAGLIKPDSVLPNSPGTVVATAAKLGRESGFLAATASTFAADTAEQIAQFNSDVSALQGRMRTRSPNETYDSARLRRVSEPFIEGPSLAEREKELVRGVNELALLWWDVVRHSPRADVERVLAFRDDMKSAFGRAAVGAVAHRGQEGMERQQIESPTGTDKA